MVLPQLIIYQLWAYFISNSLDDLRVIVFYILLNFLYVMKSGHILDVIVNSAKLLSRTTSYYCSIIVRDYYV